MSKLGLIARILFALSLSAQVAAWVVFAALIDQEIRPYFLEHPENGSLDPVTLVYAYLCTAVVIGSIGFWAHAVYTCVAIFGKKKHGKRPTNKWLEGLKDILYVLAIFGTITMVMLATPTAMIAWSWWEKLKASGEESLAQKCLGLSIMTIVPLALIGGLIVVGIGHAALNLYLFAPEEDAARPAQPVSQNRNLDMDLRDIGFAVPAFVIERIIQSNERQAQRNSVA